MIFRVFISSIGLVLLLVFVTAIQFVIGSGLASMLGIVLGMLYGFLAVTWIMDGLDD